MSALDILTFCALDPTLSPTTLSIGAEPVGTAPDMASTSRPPKRPRSCASPSVLVPYEEGDLDTTISYDTVESLYLAPRSKLIRLAEANTEPKDSVFDLFRAVQHMCIAFAKLGFYSTPNLEVTPGDDLDQLVEMLRAESLTVSIEVEVVMTLCGTQLVERDRYSMQISWEKEGSAEN